VNFVKEEIEIITLFDTRQDPDKLKQQIDLERSTTITLKIYSRLSDL